MDEGIASPLPSCRRVLLIEDEYFLADDLGRMLAERGLEVVGPVATLDQASRLLETEKVECAVLDINLRGEMAFPIADRLVERGISFVFATGYSRSALPDRFSHVPLLEKPFDPDRLFDMLPLRARNAH